MNSIPLLAPTPADRAAGAVALEQAVQTALDGLGPAGAVTLVVNDPQRHTSTAAVLGRLAGPLKGRRLRALVATGTHGFDGPARRTFAREVLSALPFQQVAWHDCRSEDLAAISGPVPWRGHPWLLDDDYALLAIGSCELHYFAGITGAHKTLTVGCAHHDDIEANHAQALAEASRPGWLAGNPVHEGIAGMLAGLEARRDCLAIDLLQVGPEVAAASAGRPLAALEVLAGQVRRAYLRRIDQPADALVLHVEGVLGRSFYQADKAIKNSEWAVRDGGCLVLDAPCPEGVGQSHFMELLREAPTWASAEELLRRRGYRLGDHKAVRLRRLTDRRGVRVFALCEGLSDEELAVLGFERCGDMWSALDAAGLDVARDRIYRVADAACVAVEAGAL